MHDYNLIESGNKTHCDLDGSIVKHVFIANKTDGGRLLNTTSQLSKQLYSIDATCVSPTGL